MKGIVCICLFAVVATTLARPEDHYTNKYDNINIEEILGNERLLIPYVECLLEKGRCTPEGKELKSHIQEALENHCQKCTDTQKEQTKKVLKHLINHRDEDWQNLRAKYDPDNKYSNKYEDELRTIKA